MLSKELEFTLNSAFRDAREKRHEFMTVEHLLLALLDNPAAGKVLRACGVEIEKLRRALARYLEENTPMLSSKDERETQPTLGFQRVLQRAVFHVQSSGKKEVTGANVLVAEVGDDDVGGRPDQRGHASQQRRESQRHQILRRWLPAPVGYADGNRKQETDRSHVVHESRQERRDPRKRRDPDGQVFRYPGIPPCDHVHQSGVVESAAQDEHCRYRNDGWMSESLVRVFRRDDTHDGEDQQSEHRDDVVTPLADDEQHESQNEDAKNDSLIHLPQSLQERSQEMGRLYIVRRAPLTRFRAGNSDKALC